MTTTDGRYMTTQEVCAYLGVCRRTVQRVAGHCLYERTSTSALYHRHLVRELYERRARGACPYCGNTAKQPPLVTCGHPRCVRTHRSTRRQRERERQVRADAEIMRRNHEEQRTNRIVRAWMMSDQQDPQARVIEVARLADVTPREVVDVMREVARR